jgi:hypothetical protein
MTWSHRATVPNGSEERVAVFTAVRWVVPLVILADVGVAQTGSPDPWHPTFALSLAAQAANGMGAIGPGVGVSGGYEYSLMRSVALRAEAGVTGFISGASVEPSCLPGSQCTGQSTPGGLAGASLSMMLRPVGIPAYVGAGVGAWHGLSSIPDGNQAGVTFAVGIPVWFIAGGAIEARYDRPSSPIGLMVGAFSVSARFTR